MAKFTSSIVPIHSKGLTLALPISWSKVSCSEIAFKRSAPKYFVSFSCDMNGDNIKYANKHLGQLQHQEFVLLPTLQLRNMG